MSDVDLMPEEPRRRARWPWFVVAVAVVVIAAVIAVAATRDDDSKATPTSKPVATTSTTLPAATTSTPTTKAGLPDTATAIWPFASSKTRFADPVAAVKSFAVDYVGFTNPIVGMLSFGPNSGEVQVRASANGPITTVFVSQLGSAATWWVIGAETAAIELDSPAAMAKISSPVRLQGTSSAFEGTVNSALHQDDVVAPLAKGLVQGGATEKAPFDAKLAFAPPKAAAGAIVLYALSAENGRVLEATVVRVRFAAQ